MRFQRATVYAGLLLAAMLLAGFGLIADEVIEGDTLSFDNAVLMWFRDPVRTCRAARAILAV